MEHYNFIATNEIVNLNAINTSIFVDLFPNFQTVALKNESELEILLQIIGINNLSKIELNNTNYSDYWNLSSIKLPEIDENEFNMIFNKWIELTNRENCMNEYGQLIFILGKSREWNNHKYRYVVKERKTHNIR